MSFDNCGGERIISLTIYGWKNNSLSIVVFTPDYIGRATMRVECEFASDDESSVFKAQLLKMLEKAEEQNTIPFIMKWASIIVFLS